MDHYRRSVKNGFTALHLNRIPEKRGDNEWIARQLESPATRAILVWRSKFLFTEDEAPRPIFFSASEVSDLLTSAESTVLLGHMDDTAFFAIDLPSNDSPLQPHISGLGRFRELRSVAALMDPKDVTLLGYARALTHWHRRHRFCGDCGSPTLSTHGGHVRVCGNKDCGQQHFPRTDPAIIVLVICGAYCLLGRQDSWPEKMYSTLAGFVEPGESIEEAVIREVLEETGVRVGEVYYHSSQPWPFPGSIMLGFTACASSGEIRPADGELEDAQWFSRDDIEELLSQGLLRLPSPNSIAYRLIEDWFDTTGPTKLQEVWKAG
jgi:NAD+ diphosphatase